MNSSLLAAHIDRRFVITSALLVASNAFAHAPLAAQDPGLFEAYVARKELAQDPLFGGLSLSGYRGLFGLRLSGGLHLARDASTTTQSGPVVRCDRRGCFRTPGFAYQSSPDIGVGGWAADLDLVFAPLRTQPMAKALLLGFSPYGFLGIGGYGVNPTNARDTALTTLSYGLGVHHDLLGWLGVGAEARNRRSLHSDSAIAIGSRRAWEYRVGLTVAFGGRRSGVPDTPPRVITVATDEQPIVTAPSAVEESDAAAARLAARVLDLAQSYVDVPYRSGGTSPTRGFDAAGFVQYVYAKERVRLPRSAREMAQVGQEVATRVGSLRPGDLVLFANDGSSVDHVAIYAGHDRILHATASGGGVRFDVLGEDARGRWFADHLVAARRVLDDETLRVSPRAGSDDDSLDRPDRAPKPNRPPQ